MSAWRASRPVRPLYTKAWHRGNPPPASPASRVPRCAV